MKKIDSFVSVLALSASLAGCGERRIPTAPKPHCPGGAQVESDMTGPFFAGNRRFDPTGRRGQLKMTYGGQATLLDAGNGVQFRVSTTDLPRRAQIHDYRILNDATEFGTTAHVIASCAE